ncbi:MAG: hypothetical protein JRE57_00250 [Deltaproteobacteria bacterium]|nr:hypothetical protein [Deltaproteobacteria bacterium]
MKLICALSIALVLGATPAFAEPKYEAKIIPKCTVYKTVGSGEICGYTLDEWKGVLVVDAEFVVTKSKLKKELARSAILALQVDLVSGQLEVYASSQKALVAQTDKLTKDLIDLDKKYQDERVKPRWGSPVAWSLAAVSTAVLAGFLVRPLLD